MLQALRGRLAGHRVFVVEDEAQMAMLVEDAVLDAGADLFGTAWDDALRLIGAAMPQAGPTVAVLDMNLQGEMATAVAERLVGAVARLTADFAALVRIGRATASS